MGCRAGDEWRSDIVRSRLAQIERSLCEAPPVLGRRFASTLAKGRGKRACLAKTDIETNFRHRELGFGQQGFGTLNSPAGQISVRRHAERFLECARKMERAELDHPSQGRQRDFVGKMLFDVLRHLFLLPRGKSSAHAGYRR